MYCSQAIKQSDTSPSGRAGGQPLTRQNSDPGTYGGDGAATGSQRGSQRHLLKALHRGCSSGPACVHSTWTAMPWARQNRIFTSSAVT